MRVTCIFVSIFSCVLAYPNAKNPPKVSNKIIGGNDTIPGEFPFQVSIQIQPIFGDRRHHCGGVILNPTHIITAAHCCDGQILNQISVIAGAQNMKVDEPTQQLRFVKRLIWHDDFDNELLHHDICVITLTETLNYTDFVQPLRITDEGFIHSGKCVSTGWGNANPTGATPIIIPDALQKITLGLVNQTQCSSFFNGIYIIDDTMLCANGLDQDKYQGSCNGDSGSAFFCYVFEESYLVGLVSFGMNPCGQYEYPTVFTNIGNKEIRDFILLEGARP